MMSVAMDAPGIRDMVAHGETGFLTREDIRDFSEKIETLVRSPEKRAVFSQAALKRARQFSSVKMAETMLEEYARLLKQPPDTLNPEVHRFKILKGLLQESLRRGKGADHHS